jgi:hypothetical protein
MEIVIDREKLTGSVTSSNADGPLAPKGTRHLAGRSPRPDLRPHPALPDDTGSGPRWCKPAAGMEGLVYDADRIIEDWSGASPLPWPRTYGRPDQLKCLG